MAATIKIKNSSTAGAAPTASDLVQGELAVNVTDKRLYTENASGTVVELGTNPSVPVTFPDGSASAPSLTNDGDTNTGLFFPAADTIALTTGGSERLRLDSSGNLGLGVTPSAWRSTYKALQSNGGSFYGFTSNDRVGVSQNAYVDATSFQWTYTTTAAATNYLQIGGEHQWYRAASGTAGNSITFTQAMTLDASGNLGIGTTSPTQRLSVAGNIVSTTAAGTDGYINFATSGVQNTVMGFNNSGSTNANGVLNNYSYIGNLNAYGIQFLANGAPKATIDSSGNLLVGTTTTSGITSGSSDNAHAFISFEGNINAQRNNGGCLYLSKASGYTSSIMVSFGVTGTERGSITTSGTAVAYNTSSDYRLKENIAPMTNALAKVAALKPCTYKWKIDGSDGEGFIAHELQAVVPEAVHGEKDAVDADGNPVYQGIDTSFLVATLTAAIQELKAEFDAYKATHP